MKRLVSIGRQYESLGSEISARLSELSGIPCYDNEALVAIAEKHGIPRETFEKADEQATSSFLYSLTMSSYSGSLTHFGTNDLVLTDRVYSIQSSEIKRIAEEGDCIIVGRCSDSILDEYPELMKIFIYAPLDVRIKRYMERTGETSEQSARKVIVKADKKRSSYYNFYSGNTWGDPKNYHLNIDSSLLGVEGTAQLIFEALKMHTKE